MSKLNVKYKLGDQVEHSKYGEGVVIDYGVYDDPKKCPDCVVFFGNEEDIITLPACELRRAVSA